MHTNLPSYSVIVPRVDRTGPTMLALDVAQSAQRAGYDVTFYYLSGRYSEADVPFPATVKKLDLRSFFGMRGIVHTHAFRPDLVGAMLSFLPGVRTITTVPSYFLGDTSFDYPKWKAILAWRAWRFGLRFFDFRVCISRSMVRYYRIKSPELRMTMIYNSRLPLRVDSSAPDDVKAWVRRQRDAGRVVLTFAGGLRPRKNVANLVAAVVGSPDVALLLLGSGPLESALRLAAAAADDRIYFGGFVERARDYIAETDALVLPSFAEGLANVILEAASVGIPSLMSNIAVHRELEAAGLGITMNHRTFSDFAEACRRLGRDYRSAERHAAIKEVYARLFDGSASYEGYAALFQELAARLDLNESKP